MSSLNGDKSRFHRERKAKAMRRKKTRGLREQMTASAAGGASIPKRAGAPRDAA
jgi:hypothetical protein